MAIHSAIADIGQDLVRCAWEEESFSAQRGLVDQLFPYIYMASKRMSTRAISRWLTSTKNIKLSAATIAKALREADRYWLEFFDEIEPAADLVARSHGYDSGLELLNEDDERGIFYAIVQTDPPELEVKSRNEYRNAVSLLEQQWFRTLDEVGREACLCAVFAARRNDPEEEKENEAEAT